MPDLYSKRPTVTRFNKKKTYAGRSIRRTRIVRRNTPKERGKKMKAMKPMMRGR